MLVPRLVTVRDENQKVVRTYTEMTNVIPGVTGGLSVISSGMDKTKDKAKEAAKESDNFRLKMEKSPVMNALRISRLTLALMSLIWKRRQNVSRRHLIPSTPRSTAPEI